jgi:hypothetical protein
MTRTLRALLLPLAAAPLALAEPPDLEGVWTNASLTTLTRPSALASLVLSETEAMRHIASVSVAGFAPEGAETPEFTHPEEGAPTAGSADFGVKAYDQFWVAPGERMAVVKGEIRSSYIVSPDNGQIPFRDPQSVMAERMKGSTRYATGVGGNDGPEATALSERCLIGFGNTGGPGMLSTLYNNTYQIVQSPDHVMILVEMVHDARIIPLFSGPEAARKARRPQAIKPWLGDSVGWYEGDELVVETVNIRPDQARVSAIPLSESGRITERFRRHSPTEIFYVFDVEDPAYYTRPWRAELSFYPGKGGLWEYACHEGNYAMPGILAGARLAERRAQPPK